MIESNGASEEPDGFIRENDLEFSAQLNTQRYLLEFLLTNFFGNDVAGLDRVMQELQRLTREASTTSEPASDELKTELLARGAVHMDRIHVAVREQILSSRGV